jgi:ribosome-binding factor A
VSFLTLECREQDRLLFIIDDGQRQYWEDQMSRRTERVAEAIREVVSRAILFEIKDPRVQGVTVTRCEVTGDLRHSKVHVSLMGTESAQKLALRGLESARGFLQRKVAERLETRYTPHIDIVVDDSVKRSLEIARLLKSVPAAASQEDALEPVDQDNAHEDDRSSLAEDETSADTDRST